MVLYFIKTRFCLIDQITFHNIFCHSINQFSNHLQRLRRVRVLYSRRNGELRGGGGEVEINNYELRMMSHNVLF